MNEIACPAESGKLNIVSRTNPDEERIGEENSSPPITFPIGKAIP